MSAIRVIKKNGQPLVRLVYSEDGKSNLKEAYRLLAKKVVELKKCGQESMSG